MHDPRNSGTRMTWHDPADDWLATRPLVNEVLNGHWRRNPDAHTAALRDPEFAVAVKVVTDVLISVADAAHRQGLADPLLRGILASVLNERLGDQAVREARDRQAAIREEVKLLEMPPLLDIVLPPA